MKGRDDQAGQGNAGNSFPKLSFNRFVLSICSLCMSASFPPSRYDLFSSFKRCRWRDTATFYQRFNDRLLYMYMRWLKRIETSGIDEIHRRPSAGKWEVETTNFSVVCVVRFVCLRVCIVRCICWCCRVFACAFCVFGCALRKSPFLIVNITLAKHCQRIMESSDKYLNSLYFRTRCCCCCHHFTFQCIILLIFYTWHHLAKNHQRDFCACSLARTFCILNKFRFCFCNLEIPFLFSPIFPAGVWQEKYTEKSIWVFEDLKSLKIHWIMR